MSPGRAYGRETGRDPGVPEALGRAVRELAGRVDAATLDVLWLFPPLRHGRREQGVLAAACFLGGDRRLLVTLRYQAEESGKGVAFRSRFEEEGEAPADRLPGIMAGVVHRAAGDLDGPRRICVEGDAERLRSVLEELGAPPQNEESVP